MSKLFVLVLGLTYATLTTVYRKGESYTAEQLGDNVDAVDEQGTKYFAEAGEAGEEPKAPSRGKVIIGKGKAKNQEPEVEVDAVIGGVSPDTITV